MNRCFSIQPALRQSQTGVALPIVMILLIVIAVLATSGMRDTAMQERMAGNMRDREAAFQAAEAALREGETWLQANQMTALSHAPMTQVTAMQWDGVSPAPIGTRPGLYPTGSELQLSADPVYYVGPPDLLWANAGVEVGIESPRYLYPVIARGVGGTDNTVVVLKTMFEPN